MYKGKKILLIIPARGGSKRLPNKNTRMLHGKPMIVYAIQAAKGSKYVDHVIVSTDSEKIAKVAKKYGAEVPFIRPADLATDMATTKDVLRHAVNFYISLRNFNPDIVMFVQPTSPLVLTEDVDGVIKKIFEAETDNCFTVCEISERPEWMYRFNKTGKPELFIKDGEGLKTRSQDLLKLYRINGSVYGMKRDLLMKESLIFSDKPSIYVMPRERSVDVDDLTDFKIASMFMRELKHNE